MNKKEIAFHLRGRWKEVEEIQLRELRATTFQQNWKRLNLIMRRAALLRLPRGGDNGEMEVYKRWEKLKAHYGTA